MSFRNSKKKIREGRLEGRLEKEAKIDISFNPKPKRNDIDNAEYKLVKYLIWAKFGQALENLKF